MATHPCMPMPARTVLPLPTIPVFITRRPFVAATEALPTPRFILKSTLLATVLGELALLRLPRIVVTCRSHATHP